jgi:hypothetical protein
MELNCIAAGGFERERRWRAHPDYRWLDRLQCVGFGEVNVQRLEVRFDIYALK